MNGVLVVDKPSGFTSFDVVAKLRGICGTKKIGHGGTLDPMATGVLPVFVGRSAKAVDLAPNQDKAYEAQILFGKRTDTGDITGDVLEEADVCIAEEQLAAVLPRFRGPQKQLPPMYSAVKVNGKALYRYAREGKTVERKERPIEIYKLDLLSSPGQNRFVIQVHCSKGTYIRTLVEDIGAALGAPATLAALRRTKAGVFTLQDAKSLAEIQQAKDEERLDTLFCPLQRVFEDLPPLALDENALHRLRNGALVQNQNHLPGRYRALAEGQFVGLVEADGRRLRVVKFFVE